VVNCYGALLHALNLRAARGMMTNTAPCDDLFQTTGNTCECLDGVETENEEYSKFLVVRIVSHTEVSSGAGDHSSYSTLVATPVPLKAW
jgi:hypothetical protein